MPYEPFASRSRAILIGIPQYEHPLDFSNIPSVKANLAQLRVVLTSGALGRLLPQTVETLTEPRTRDRALHLIDTAVAQAQDLLLCYFSGHGYVDLETGEPELYLMTRESTKEAARLNGIPYTALLAKLASSRADRVVLILDCCYAGNAGLVPLPDRPFSLITSSRIGSRIHKGNGIDPTPFTAALVQVLREGTHPHDTVTVQSLGKRLRQLADQDAATPDPDADYDPWWPTERSCGSANDTVLSQARHAERPAPAWRRLAQATRQRLRRVAGYAAFAWTWAFGPGRPVWHRATGGCLALALLAGAATVYRIASRPDPLCPTPLELRVLTSPETRAPLTSVLDVFQDSADATTSLGGRPEGCGQINTTVYAAPADRVTAAFRASAAWAEPERACTTEACVAPLRDVGPHPDVWIPASSTTYIRVLTETERPESVVELGRRTTLASSPAVLAATTPLGNTPRTGRTLAELLDAARTQDVQVSRAAPQSSEAALLHTLHLPATAAGALTEAGTGHGVPPADDRALACEDSARLDDNRDRSQALLTAELTVAALVSAGLDSRPPCLETTYDYRAYYPSDVPALDLSFVPVTWETAHADTADRAEAVRRLAAWLSSAPGQRALNCQGFRGTASACDAPGGSPLDGAAFTADPRSDTRLPSRPEIESLLQEYEGERPRRDVLFAVDVSSSAYSDAAKSQIRTLLTRATDSLSGRDRYGITGIPAEGAAALPLRRHSTTERNQALDRLRPVERNAPIASTVRDGTADLAGTTESGVTPLFVLITDDEDSQGVPRHDPDVPVLVVSLQEIGCDLDFNTALTKGNGACVSASQDLPDRLVAAIDDLTASRP